MARTSSITVPIVMGIVGRAPAEDEKASCLFVFSLFIVTLSNYELVKPSLNPDDLNSFRPISNLTFLSKIIERIATKQLTLHMRIRSERAIHGQTVSLSSVSL